MKFCLISRTKLFVLFSFLWCVCFVPVFNGSVVVVVSRNSKPADSFKIYTECSTDTCLSMGAVLQPGGLNHCNCRCLTSLSTFIEQDRYTTSKCVDNVDVRSKYAQCQYQLSPNTPSSPLSVLDLSQQQPLNVTWSSPKPKPVCPVMQGNGQFLFKGEWFNATSETTYTLDNNVFKWSGPASYPGYLIRVRFSCQSHTHCLVFKAKGSITYILGHTSLTTTTTTTTTILPSPSPKPTSPRTSTSTMMTFKTSKVIVIPVTPTTILPTRTRVNAATSSVVPIGGISSNQVHSCSRGTGVFCQWLYVGLTAAGCVVLLLVVIAVVFLSCKGGRRKSSNSNKKSEAAFMDCELPSKKCSCNTELMTLVVQDGNKIGKSLACPEHSSEEELQHNQPNGKRNSYSRPLKFVESEVRQIIPTSVQRLSSLTEDVFTDNDKRQLLRQQSSQSSLQTTEGIKRCLAPKDALLRLENEEEDTYEVMDSKMLPRENKKSRTKGKMTNEISGIENQSFQEEDKRLSIYETVEDCKNSHRSISDEQPSYETMGTSFPDGQPNYEAMESGFSDEQPNYEAMESGFSDEQPNYEAMESGFNDEQPNYEAMETSLSEEQPNYEDMHIVRTLSNQMHKKVFSSSRKNQKQDQDELYEIPVIIGNEEETEYEIPPISMYFQKQCANSNALTVHCGHGYQDDDEYTYANTPEFQEREARKKLQGRRSWHSGDQNPKTREQNFSGTRIVHPGFRTRKQSQETESNEFQEDEDELYSVAKHPRPPPELKILSTENSPARHSTFLTETTDTVSPSNGKTKNSPETLGSVMGIPAALRSQNRTPRMPTSTKQKTIDERQLTGNKTTCDNDIPFEQPIYSNLPQMSDVIDSDPFPGDSRNSHYDEEGKAGDSETFFDNFDENLNDNEQPLYENFGVCST